MTTEPLSQDRYDEIEQAIYEAAVVSDRWPLVLQRLSEVGGGLGGVLFGVDETSAKWTASPSALEMMRDFVTHGWAERNTRLANGLRRGLGAVPRFVTEADYFDPGEMEQDPLYTEFFWPRGVGHSAGTLATLPHGDLVVLSVERAREHGPVTPVELANLDSLRPHLVRAAMLSARLGFERVRTAVETLDHLGFAAAAVEQRGRVTVSNGGFNRESADWTTRMGDRIAFLDRDVNAIVETSLERIGSASGVRSIPLKQGDLPVRQVLHIVPVRRSAQDIFARASAILVITSVSQAEGSPGLLQALFDLTPAEASLARKIGAGLTVEQIAVEEGRSPHTLRNQLKDVLGKTGQHRQTELAVMLNRLIPPGL